MSEALFAVWGALMFAFGFATGRSNRGVENSLSPEDFDDGVRYPTGD